MERERRGAHTPHQHRRLVLRNRSLGTSGDIHVLNGIVELLVEPPKVTDAQKERSVGEGV